MYDEDPAWGHTRLARRRHLRPTLGSLGTEPQISSVPGNARGIMPTPTLIQPQFHTAPTEAPPAVTPVPGDLLADSLGRLRAACVVWAVLWTTAILVNHLVLPRLSLARGEVIPWPPVADGLAALCIAASVLVYRYAGRFCRQPGTLVNLSLAYEVVLAAAIGLINQWQPEVLAGRLSWICALVLLQPSIVPGPTRKILVASLVAASMDPLGLSLENFEQTRIHLLLQRSAHPARSLEQCSPPRLPP